MNHVTRFYALALVIIVAVARETGFVIVISSPGVVSQILYSDYLIVVLTPIQTTRSPRASLSDTIVDAFFGISCQPAISSESPMLERPQAGLVVSGITRRLYISAADHHNPR